MNIIYEGADTTIIAMSSESAKSGLPRMHENTQMYPQLKCVVDGKRLCGLMPTLSQQVWMSTWGNRGWTLQEALLSRRCIYLSDFQLYFECNAMQCCEALNESNSWVHQTYRDKEFVRDGHSEPVIGAGVLRSPFVGSQHTSDRLRQYLVLANLYSIRNLTDPADAINGFSGILKYLQKVEYTKGFFWGLPVEDLNWALMWQVRSSVERRPGFPSWSWAGWTAVLSENEPDDIKRPHYYQIYLKAWKQVSKEYSKKLVPIFDSRPLGEAAAQDFEALLEGNPLKGLIASEAVEKDFNLRKFPKADTRSWLFVEGLVFHFKPDFSTPLEGVRSHSRLEFFEMYVAGIKCFLQIMSTDAIIGRSFFRKKLRFLLLARDRDEDDVLYHLLAFTTDRGKHTSKRETALTLRAPFDRPDVLKHLNVQKRKIILR